MERKFVQLFASQTIEIVQTPLRFIAETQTWGSRRNITIKQRTHESSSHSHSVGPDSEPAQRPKSSATDSLHEAD